ncbi:MAG: hypothetical protein Q9191_002877 [Dirinaria sp. TL-2023a]
MPYGVSNSFKRGTIRTYARQSQRVLDVDGIGYPPKRICISNAGKAVGIKDSSGSEAAENCSRLSQIIDGDVDASSSTVPSSPPQRDAQIYSDKTLLNTDSDLSSPPSSPPLPMPSPVRTALKPAFSILKRKRSAVIEPEPLAESDHNARKVPRLKRASSLKQMQIDLGGDVRKTCEECGMEYIPSNSEDLALHREFHNMNKDGVEIGRIFLKDKGAKSVALNGRQLRRDEDVVMIDRRCSLASRNKVKKVLEVVNAELSAADIEDSHLWGGIDRACGAVSTRKTTKNEGSTDGGTRFKAFLYLAGDKCIGLCLVERIASAYRAADASTPGMMQMRPPANTLSSAISISDKKDVALLGVTRIWTSRTHRRQGVAVVLLECARRHFFYGMEVTKDLIAFSQPTESGGNLAKHWFGANTGWHVFR